MSKYKNTLYSLNNLRKDYNELRIEKEDLESENEDLESQNEEKQNYLDCFTDGYINWKECVYEFY